MPKLLNIPKNTHGFVIRMMLFLSIYSINIWAYIKTNNTIYDVKIETSVPYLTYLIFPCIGLFLLARWREIKEMTKYANDVVETIFFSLLAATIYFTPVTLIHDILGTENWFISIHAPFLTSQLLIFIAIFNVGFIKRFQKDLMVCLISIGIMFFATYFIEYQWEVFSGIIMGILRYILPTINETAIVNLNSKIISMNNFTVNIGAPCAGIYSIVAFMLLFITTLYFESISHRIDKWRALAVLLSGMVAVFILNTIRITIIILIGAYYSPELAINLFHEYLGAIFLLGLFFIYLKYIIPKTINVSHQTLPQAAYSSR